MQGEGPKVKERVEEGGGKILLHPPKEQEAKTKSRPMEMA